MADGDHAKAVARYEVAYRDYASVSQTINAGRLLAPQEPPRHFRAERPLHRLERVCSAMKAFESPAKNIALADYTDAPTV